MLLRVGNKCDFKVEIVKVKKSKGSNGRMGPFQNLKVHYVKTAPPKMNTEVKIINCSQKRYIKWVDILSNTQSMVEASSVPD